TAGIEPGVFTCYIGTDKENFARVKREFLEEVNRIRDTPPTEKELADVKQYLVGSRMLQFATNGGIASQLLSIERFGLGFDYLSKFQKEVEAVTPADVRAVARRYLDPERMVVVAAGRYRDRGGMVGVGAGPVDERGEPLK